MHYEKIFIISILTIFALGGQLKAEEKTANLRNTTPQEKQSLLLTIKGNVGNGRLVGIIATFKNTGSKTVILAHPGSCIPDTISLEKEEVYNISEVIEKAKLKIQIIYPTGKQVNLISSPFSNFLDLNGNSLDHLIIEPGESKKIVLTQFHLSPFPRWDFYPAKPAQLPMFPLKGLYRITVSYTNTLSRMSTFDGKILQVWKGNVTSNTIAVDILNPQTIFGSESEEAVVLPLKSVYERGERIEIIVYNNSDKSIFVPYFEEKSSKEPVLLSTNIGFLERCMHNGCGDEGWERIPSIPVEAVAKWKELKPADEVIYDFPTELVIDYFFKDDMPAVLKHLDGNFLIGGHYRIGIYYCSTPPLVNKVIHQQAKIAYSSTVQIDPFPVAIVRTDKNVYNRHEISEIKVKITNTDIDKPIYLSRFAFGTLQIKGDRKWETLYGWPHGIDSNVISQSIPAKGDLETKIHPNIWRNETGKMDGFNMGMACTFRIPFNIYLGCKVGGGVKECSKEIIVYSNEFTTNSE